MRKEILYFDDYRYNTTIRNICDSVYDTARDDVTDILLQHKNETIDYGVLLQKYIFPILADRIVEFMHKYENELYDDQEFCSVDKFLADFAADTTPSGYGEEFFDDIFQFAEELNITIE